MHEKSDIDLSNRRFQNNDSPKSHNPNWTVDGNSELETSSNISTAQTSLPQLRLRDNEKEGDCMNVSTVEEQVQKAPYPKSILFIIITVVCISFGFLGMQSILVLYLSGKLGYNSDDATIIFHIFVMSSFFLSIFGAIISDSWLGKFKTISYFMILLFIASTLITVGAIPPLNLPTTVFTMIGLMLTAIGAGGVLPCISAFGGDQFTMPEQANKLKTFFPIYYFSLNVAVLTADIITPILREDVHCFGEKDCYLVAFGAEMLVLGTSTILFILARTLYKITPPTGNMVVLVSKTIGGAISVKWKESKTNPRGHWLDYADKKYDHQLIEDIKVLMRILVLFLPLPFYWALFYQQASRWTLQATRMNGDMGSWNIKPEQMQMFNPLLVLIFIPLCEFAIYPLLNLIGFRRSLQKLSLGGILAGMAFIISGLVQLKVEQTYPNLPPAGIAQLRVYNGEFCDYKIATNLADYEFDINSLETYVNKSLSIDSTNGLNLQLKFNAKSPDDCPPLPTQSCFLQSEKSYFVFLNSKNTTHPVICAEDIIAKPNRGFPLARTLANIKASRKIQWKNSKGSVEYTEQASQRNLTEFKADTYELFIDNIEIEAVKLEVGGIYTILIAENSSSEYRSNIVIVTNPNSVSILWQIPQYTIMTLGEVMFSVTGFEFSYAQAPETMKSVLQAFWLLTIAFGNLIVIIVAELSLFDSQAYEFFLFAGLMLADMIVFMFIAYRYIPNHPVPNTQAEAPSTTVKSELHGIDNPAKTIEE
ncbi:peptide transporter family 1-like [Eurosta solidaginis]|uniref:peptide transporter family 1-like n=1 Tax=Eurosta solidaginis TaxID=178769 RepID=UPI0035307023